MRVALEPPNAQDQFYLIRTVSLMDVLDHEDLARRKSESIEDAYHLYWFSRRDDGVLAFHAPEFYLENGIVNFINGRHRTLLLCRYLTEFPMALTEMDGYPICSPSPSESSVKVLSEISIRRLSGQEIFCFPDLPTGYLGYDQNIGK